MDTVQTACLCMLFRLGKPVYKPQAVQGGMLHRLWRLHTTRGVFAIKQHTLPLLVEWSRLATEASKILRRTSVVSHRVLDQKNVIWRYASSPVVIDWEAAGLTNPTMDVVGAALSWSGQIVQPPREVSFHALLEGYITAGGVIHDTGIVALHGVIGNWLGWLLFNMHRSLGESVNSEEKRVLGVRETTRTLSSLRALAANADIWARWVDT